MKGSVSKETLARENRQFQDTGGVSAVNRSHHFIPAFQDSASGKAYQSCFADGTPAPIHILEGLPDYLVCERSDEGDVKSAVDTVTAGFLYAGQFYTREQAAAALAEPAREPSPMPLAQPEINPNQQNWCFPTDDWQLQGADG
ncbi:hypothetical protein [Pseudomaricurvus alcaniphilus]|uniref:hypothetical protein n=1 Tax=Pseudomaricurvus alcaniphilus TaxID=1166482 RepID=UPI001AA00BA5|nr:hypothetical protein [Pseudomaricurvus alcaniphilus]